MEQKKLEALREAARRIRVGIIKGTHAAKSGHPGGSLSIADVMAYLYFEEINLIDNSLSKGEKREDKKMTNIRNG